jgi:4-hydroxy-4-methyl-2-oxoglutarate aldolase
MGFPAWCKAICAFGTLKETLGDVNVGVVCAGQWVEPADVIVADDDGVVAVARDRAAEVLDACAAREEREAASRRRYRAGELSLDIQGMRERLEQKGLRYVDEPPPR